MNDIFNEPEYVKKYLISKDQKDHISPAKALNKVDCGGRTKIKLKDLLPKEDNNILKKGFTIQIISKGKDYIYQLVKDKGETERAPNFTRPFFKNSSNNVNNPMTDRSRNASNKNLLINKQLTEISRNASNRNLMNNINNNNNPMTDRSRNASYKNLMTERSRNERVVNENWGLRKTFNNTSSVNSGTLLSTERMKSQGGTTIRKHYGEEIVVENIKKEIGKLVEVRNAIHNTFNNAMNELYNKENLDH